MANSWVSLLILGSLLAPQSGDLREIVSKDHGLSWKVPKSWTVKQSKTQMTITIPSGASTAKLNIFATYYRRPAEDWQKLQATIAEQLSRKLDRQWEEQVLGVPLLLTRTSSASDVRITGLLYAAVRNKLHFTFEAPLNGADEAWESWKEAMQSLRTLGDDLPSIEDGVKPLTAPTPADRRPEAVRLAGSKPQPGIRLGPVRTEASAANRPVVLRTEKEWVLTAAEDWFKLTHPKLVGKVQVTVFSELDSPEASRAISLWADLNLQRFQSVTQRVNSGPKRNEAGANVWTVLRQGQSESGALVTYAAAGASGGFYWLLEYESDDAKVWAADHKLLEKFVTSAGFEPSS